MPRAPGAPPKILQCCASSHNHCGYKDFFFYKERLILQQVFSRSKPELSDDFHFVRADDNSPLFGIYLTESSVQGQQKAVDAFGGILKQVENKIQPLTSAVKKIHILSEHIPAKYFEEPTLT